MSTTIGFGCITENKEDLSEKIRKIAFQYGYGIVFGLEKAEDDMREGLEVISKKQNWNLISLLKSSPKTSAALAYEIEEELVKYELEGIRPKFFAFLLSLSLLLSGLCSEFTIFFSGEWYKNDKVRKKEGYIEDLILYLRMNGNWCERLYIPQVDEWQDSDETPFIYTVYLSTNRG